MLSVAADLADLEHTLQAMLTLKSPGVSGSGINTLTRLCIANVKCESVLVKKICTHFKNAPSSHKLGVLYVIDSVIRKWLGHAKQQGQPVGSSAADGSFAAGVNRVTAIMPDLMNDIISSGPQEQRQKIRKLVDIWEQGQTLPCKMIEGFKDNLNNHSAAPPVSPLANTLPSLSNRPTPAPPAVLANITKTMTHIACHKANNIQNTPPNSPPAPVQQGTPFMPTSQEAAPTVYPPATLSKVPRSHSVQLHNLGARTGIRPAAPGLRAGATDQTASQVALTQQLIQDGQPQEQFAAVFKALGCNTGVAAPRVSQPNQSSYSLPLSSINGWALPRPGGPRAPRSLTNRTSARSRSRSPRGHREHRNSSRGTDERRFGDYAHNSPSCDGNNGCDRSRKYRQRSPQRQYGHTPYRGELPAFQHLKRIEHDLNLPSGYMKVLSRTLFVSGVDCSNSDLRNIFSDFGTVQTCMVIEKKRHAFVKMYSREDAVNAKEAMDSGGSPGVQLRTRWGSGFGPRDCSDFKTGISVIPIHRLTEADRRWMLTAPYGGCGGQIITQGMVVEEPDIEIGNGLSSKAISKRKSMDHPTS